MSDQELFTVQEKEPDTYQVKIDTFEGPLDLLLHLVKTSEVDIYDIKIADITHQYLKYLSFLVVLNLENITEFVEMATTLILIKSRSLLPVEAAYVEEEDDLRNGLIAKLLEYQKYKIAAGILEVRNEESIPFVAKSNEPGLFKLEDAEDANWKQLTVLDLVSAFADVLNQNTESDTTLEVLMFNFTVDEKIKLICQILTDKESFNYFELIRENMPKLELVCTFLALLELVKKGMIAIRQHILFGDIHVVKKKEIPAVTSHE